MARYLDPKADIVFKKVFGEHPHLLISFLNAVLPLPSDAPIVQLSYLSNEQIPNIPDFKKTIADVRCIDSKGRVFIVEMQINWTKSFKQRLLFGASQALVKQLDKGETYQLLQPVYGLGIVAENYEEGADWYHHYRLVKRGESTADVIEHLQLVFIELPKFPIHSLEEKKLRLLWLRFLREIDEKTRVVPQDLLDIPEISEAIQLVEEAAYTPGELNTYDDYWESVRREKTLFFEARAEGRAEGIAEGITKGRAEGITKGRAEGNAEAIELVVLNMIKQNYRDQEIMNLVQISSTDLERYKKRF